MDAPATFGILLAFGMCVALPLAVVLGVVYHLNRRARERHAERMAMIDRGLVPDAAASAPPPPSQPSSQAPQPAVEPPLPLAPQPVPAPKAADPDQTIGWAVGLIVAGMLWIFGPSHFGALLVGCGAAYLTRGLLGMRKPPSSDSPGDLP